MCWHELRELSCSLNLCLALCIWLFLEYGCFWLHFLIGFECFKYRVLPGWFIFRSMPSLILDLTTYFQSLSHQSDKFTNSNSNLLAQLQESLCQTDLQCFLTFPWEPSAFAVSHATQECYCFFELLFHVFLKVFIQNASNFLAILSFCQ